MNIKLPKSKSKYGYTEGEVRKILKKYDVSWFHFNKKFGVNTCTLDPKTSEVLIYACDITRTIECCLENREIYPWEWD